MASKKKPAAKKVVPAKKVTAVKKAAKKPVKKVVAKVKKVAAKKPAIVKGKKAAPAPKPEPKKAVPTPPARPVLVVPKNQAQYTQSEFIDCLRGYCGFPSRRETKEFYLSFVDMLQGGLKSGYKMVLPGLGRLLVRKTKARTGRNPATGETIQIPARRKVAFTASKAMKEAVLS